MQSADGKEVFKVNLCVLLKCCESCELQTPRSLLDPVTPCKICGDKRLFIWHDFDDENIDPAEELRKWAQRSENKHYRLIAHNMKA